MVKAANVKIDSYWPGLFAKLFEKKNIEDLIFNVGSGKDMFRGFVSVYISLLYHCSYTFLCFLGGAAPAVVAAPVAGGADAAAAAPAAEEKKVNTFFEYSSDAVPTLFGFLLFICRLFPCFSSRC